MLSEAQLQADLQTAMKARASDKVLVLRDVMTAIKNLKVDKMTAEIAEPDIVALIRKEVSKRTEAIEFARKAAREDLIAKNEAEKSLLEAYLPQLMTADELQSVIRSISTELGTTQIGPVMAKLREGYAGKFDGKLASELVRKLG